MGVVALSGKERRRLELLSQVREGALKLVKAAALAGVSYRQMKRVWARYQKEGDGGLVHRGRGRPSNRQLDPALRAKILERYEARYEGFGPTLASEYLAEEGLEIDHETLRRWLMAEGLWKKHKRRKKHRQRRQRRAQRGELVQMDGSHHDWFEGRREWAVLMVLIDDATNRTYARFYEAEDTAGAMESFGRYARRYGLPQALYVDRDSIYECTREARIDEELRGEGPETQFGRAMRQLGVEIILANSPQAKGRVERRNGLFQDRLVKGMRLEGIDTLEAANEYLEKKFLPMLNRRFTLRGREAGDLHRRIPKGLRLEEVLCWEEPRVVQKDWTVRWRNRFFQINARHEALALPGRRIVVREKLSGQVRLLYHEQALRFREIAQRPRPKKKATPLRRDRSGPHRPATDHPWRKPLLASAVRRRRSGRGSPPATPPGTPSRKKGTFLSSAARGHS
jgi:transposase